MQRWGASYDLDGISTPENALQPPFYPFRVVRNLDMHLRGWQWIGN